jgi:hypothetical protein
MVVADHRPVLELNKHTLACTTGLLLHSVSTASNNPTHTSLASSQLGSNCGYGQLHDALTDICKRNLT